MRHVHALVCRFKPVEMRHVLLPFKEDFEVLLCQSFSKKQNKRFLGHINNMFSQRNWKKLLELMKRTQEAAIDKLSNGWVFGASLSHLS